MSTSAALRSAVALSLWMASSAQDVADRSPTLSGGMLAANVIRSYTSTPKALRAYSLARNAFSGFLLLPLL